VIKVSEEQPQESNTQSNAQRLLEALINKMEDMDSRMMNMEYQLNTPHTILRKAGYVAMRTPMAEGNFVDDFRHTNEVSETSSALIKAQHGDLSNEDIHKMSWEDIHDMASKYDDRQPEMY
tara:strand:+ start:718 stop:1080 length:363 start_codon:yes stop_codon:yes gene_type:complete